VISFSVTTVILGITVIISLLAFNDKDLSYKLTFSPYSVKHHKRWWLLFSHGLIHSDYMHLGLNMYVLYAFGDIVEQTFSFYFGALGIVYFIGLYIGGMLLASLPAMAKHGDNPSYLAVGASGAVSAVVFSSIIIHPTGGMGIIFLPGLYIPSFIFGVLYLFAEHYMSKRGGTRIAHDAHIGGALFGVLFTVMIDFRFLTNFFSEVNNWFSTIF